MHKISGVDKDGNRHPVVGFDGRTPLILVTHTLGPYTVGRVFPANPKLIERYELDQAQGKHNGQRKK